MSYWHVQRTASAKAYLAERDAEERIANAPSPQLATWRGWLDDYRSRPRPTAFDWRPKLAVEIPVQFAQQPPGDDVNGEESKEGPQQGEEVGAEQIREGLGDAPSERSAAGDFGPSVPVEGGGEVDTGDAWWDK